MSKFTTKPAFVGPRPPEATVPVPKSAFAEDWPTRKQYGEIIVVGLRRISDGSVSKVRGEASKIASLFINRDEDPDGWVDAYNDALMRQTVAHATCRANDVSLSFFEMAEDTVQTALTSDGVRFLHDAVVAHAAATSPLQQELDPAEQERLIAMLDAGAIAKLGRRGIGVSRMLRKALEDIDALMPEGWLDETGDDENVITVKARPRL